jgi:HlyD family secretion protein
VKKIIAGIVVLLIVGGGFTYYITNRKSEPQYKTAKVSRGSIRSSITATGTMNAVTTVLVGTQVSGTIKKLNVDFNSRVKKGQVIAEIDPASLQAQADQARANVMVARANVQKAEAAQADSGRIKNRNRQLFSRNLIARSDLDTSEANHDANEAQVAASNAQVAQAEAALRIAETNLRYTKIVSPVDGIVVSRSVDVGQTVAASFQTPTLFTIAQDLTKMQIDTSVDEADIGRIRKGQPVEFTVDAYPDSTFSGNVEEIRIAPTTVQNVVTYDVVVKVRNEDLRLKPGMTANVTIIVASKDDVLKVSNTALRFRPSEQESNGRIKGTSARTAPAVGLPGAVVAGRDKSHSDKPSAGGPYSQAGPRAMTRAYGVWMLENGRLKRIPVTIGISDGTFTEIAAGNLREQDEVITESLSIIRKRTNGGPQSTPRFMR